MGHGLCPGAELKHRQNLGTGIDGEPEPLDLLGVAQPGAQFVQLEMGGAGCESSARAGPVRVHQHGTARW